MQKLHPKSSQATTPTTLPLHSNAGLGLRRRKKQSHGRSLVLLLFILALGSLHHRQRSRQKQDSRQRSAAAADPRILKESEPIGSVHDIAIIGAGPAGLTAALFGARSGLDVVVLGSETGLLSETQHLDNFPSYSIKGNGPSWLKATKEQALHFGAKFATPGLLATELSQPLSSSSYYVLKTPPLEDIRAWSVIVATGATPRRLGLPKEDDLWGNSLHNCAICDGHLYQDKNVLVAGGGDAAMDAAILLARYSKRVYLVHRRNQFSASNQASIELVQSTTNIEVLTPYTVQQWEVNTTNNVLLTGALIRHVEGTEERVLSVDGAFVMIGATPNTDWLKGTVELDEEGFVKMKSSTSTNRPGVFAAGEVSDNIYKQAITASADGARAAIDAERWLRETLGVVRKEKSISAEKVPAEVAGSSREEPPKKEEAVQKQQELVLETRTLSDDCDLTTPDCIHQVVNKHPVVVFSKPWCPYCRKALEALSLAGISQPYIIDLSALVNAAEIQSTLLGITGRRTVPNVFVGGKSIGGGDETSALQAQGRLVPLLVERGALPSVATTATATKKEEEKEEERGEESCDLIEESCMQEIIQEYPIVMFSLSWCPECQRSLELLSSIGVKDLHIIDLDDYNKATSQRIRQNMLTLTGRRSVPNLFVGGENFGGFAKTTAMHKEGKLLAKLKEIDKSPLEKT